MNELDILKLVASRLDSAGFSYMLSGSVALTFYGKPRMTRNIDIVVKIFIDEVDMFVALWSARLGLDMILARVLDERHQ